MNYLVISTATDLGVLVHIKHGENNILQFPLDFSNYSDLLKASESSLDFWNNQADEVWNNV